jgi:hypothetical protein
MSTKAETVGEFRGLRLPPGDGVALDGQQLTGQKRRRALQLLGRADDGDGVNEGQDDSLCADMTWWLNDAHKHIGQSRLLFLPLSPSPFFFLLLFSNVRSLCRIYVCVRVCVCARA